MCERPRWVASRWQVGLHAVRVSLHHSCQHITLLCHVCRLSLSLLSMSVLPSPRHACSQIQSACLLLRRALSSAPVPPPSREPVLIVIQWRRGIYVCMCVYIYQLTCVMPGDCNMSMWGRSAAHGTLQGTRPVLVGTSLWCIRILICRMSSAPYFNKWVYLTGQDHLATAEAPACPWGDDIRKGFSLSATASAPLDQKTFVKQHMTVFLMDIFLSFVFLKFNHSIWTRMS